ncbi:PX domain containing protein [Coccidioides posadasii C735 delta SOWgp]|uniref:PX domain containing protein n=1 Tax=Coccidioides posadasii (strain C735) TaxID=222929 RepID=C5P8G7_COCP7|nr:PX domain containing protein [Coccidioides posadasii C735 delta SOWgp]EER26029.1 PX domain containing protein [Coccidioides posadasii C735 delta SOWgp]|eukprot:XP_003068174.1 PX domain containing protein [Coccidioides posadasii C735 delta SOWgp]
MAPIEGQDAPLKATVHGSQQSLKTEAQPPTLTNHILSLFSRCNSSSFVAITGGLFACLYVVFGRLALLFIGAVGGAILHAWWEEWNDSPGENKANEALRRRRELGIELAERLMRSDVISMESTPAEHPSVAKIQNGEPDLSTLHPAPAAALEAVVNAVIKDYIRWWYDPILPSETNFPRACRESLVSFIHSVSVHLSRKRPAELFLQFVMNSSSIMIVFLSEISIALGPANANATSVADAINIYLEEFPESGLANIVSIEEQRKRLRVMASELLKNFLDSTAYDCAPVQIFLREIVTGVIFESIIKTCSAPDYINGWIIHLLEGGEPEFINAIDAGLDALDKVSDTQLNPGPTDISPAHGDPDSIITDRESPNPKTRHNLATTVLTGSDPMGVPSTDESGKAHCRNQSINGMVSPENTVVQHEKMGNHSEALCQATSATLDSGEGVSSGIISLPTFTTIEGASVSPGSMDGCHISKASNGTSPLIQNRGHTPSAEALAATPSAAKLLHASISILEDFATHDDGIMRSKPTTEYLVQVEPKCSHLSGWMIARQYTDFESLHETLRRISVVSGVTQFSMRHPNLPDWKNRNAEDLRGLLENYLQDALHHEALAESEGLKRFFEKGLGAGFPSISVPTRIGSVFRNPAVLENMGKGVLGVISTAPKGVAEGGKAVLGGVSGFFGSTASGAKRRRAESPTSRSRPEFEETIADHAKSAITESHWDRSSRPELEDHGDRLVMSHSQLAKVSDEPPTTYSSSFTQSVSAGPWKSGEIEPISDHGVAFPNDSTLHLSCESFTRQERIVPHRGETQSTTITTIQSAQGNETLNPKTCEPAEIHREGKAVDSKSNPHAALSEEEAIMVVELLFAVVNEIYGLSSAWKFRKRLLHAAKAFLLRPGNPNLEAIRLLIQDSIIKDNTTHETLADYINMLRESCFSAQNNGEPATPLTLTEKDRKKMQERARSLLIENGMPSALISCMGSNATSEALGRIFDSLQIESVARGFVCAVLLQALKVIVQ